MRISSYIQAEEIFVTDKHAHVLLKSVKSYSEHITRAAIKTGHRKFPRIRCFIFE